jgi:hypothetical protein
MIIKSFSIPSASCVHSVVRPMTADEIRLMNEQLAARRAAYVAQVRAWNSDPDAVDVETEPVSEWQDERNSRPEPY